jgi:adenylate cyclase
MNLAQRTIRSFARFVPKEIVRGVMDKSVSAELGGVREEVTVVFTDGRDFTTIAESADPDMLMRQCRGISPCLQRLSSPKAEQSTSLLATP